MTYNIYSFFRSYTPPNDFPMEVRDSGAGAIDLRDAALARRLGRPDAADGIKLMRAMFDYA